MCALPPMNGPTGLNLFDADISTPMATFNEIWFSAVSEPYGWMSNMSPHPVEHGGFTWPTTEALFQALRFKDPEIRKDIRIQTSPRGAEMKAKGKDYQDLRVVEPKSEQDLENMRLCLRLKLAQHGALAGQLCDTGDRTIYALANAHDDGDNRLFWGARREADDGLRGENQIVRI